MTRTRGFRALAASTLTVVLALTVGPTAVAETAGGATVPSPTTAAGWQLSTDAYAPAGEGGYVPTYVGNGYFAARIPVEGTGFSTTPVTTESQLAGFYGQGPGTTIQRASLPAWSTLGFSDGSATYGVSEQQACAEGAVCEAEDGELSGAARVATDHPGYTGRGFVAGFAASGNVPQRGSTASVLVATPSAGATTLTVRYAAGANTSTQTLTATVDGAATTVRMPATKDWNTWATVTVPITVGAGETAVALGCGTSDTCVVNVDSITVGSTGCAFGALCEAEAGTLAGAAKIAADHNGFTGTGFVAGFASGGVPKRGSGTTVRFADAPAGDALVTVRYAAATNSSSQTLTASVDGGAGTSFTMPATASWDTWGTVTVPVSLTAGDHAVTISCGTADTCLVNVDAVGLSAGPIGGSEKSPVSDYEQTLDLHTGLLTTRLTWTSPAGHRTRLTYEVFVSRAETHVAAVRVTAQPLGWSGRASFVDLLDGRATVLPASHRTPSPIDLTTISGQQRDGARHLISEKASTVGLGMTAGLASTLVVGDGTGDTAAVDRVPARSVAQQGSVDLQDSRTYTVTKYVGVASGTDTADGSAPLVAATNDPVVAAVEASSAAADAGWDRLLGDHEDAWARLWRSDITVPGDAALTLQARSALFYMLESVRDGVDWSMSPGGLSSAEYNGHVFWDAETWMYPALLAAHPDLASGMNEYRHTLLDAATATASSHGLQGAQFPWESAQTGADVGIHPREIHITGDVALAQWDYYQATGDLTWLREKGWPVLQGAARYYASRAVSTGDGRYELRGVEGPDENHDNVNNSAYVNVSGFTTLQIAERAAALLGVDADPGWDAVAKGLAQSIPFDPATNTHLEYDGYSGATVNQADVVMLQYPWNYPMPKEVAQADLDYYTPRTAASGPAMTDAINMIDTAALSTPGCSAYTYFRRSLDPYAVGPFDQYSEHLKATGVIDFTTGLGGFLQELYYGFTGLRWDTDAVVLDPMLPPQLPGLDLTGLSWHGRTFDVSVARDTTTVTLTSGEAMPVSAGGRTRTVRPGSSITLATRTPDTTPTTDLARCATVDATSADPSYPAVAAVDGSAATQWKATSAGATLTADLGRVQPVRDVTVVAGGSSTTPYTVRVSSDGKEWTTLGSVAASAGAQSRLDVSTLDPAVTAPIAGALPGSVDARYVQYQAASGVTAAVQRLSVTNGLPGAPTAVTVSDVGSRHATVSWTAPDDAGDAPITTFAVTAVKKNGKPEQTVTVAGTSATFTGLKQGVAYTFTVRAVNAVGTGPSSEPSVSVRWAPGTGAVFGSEGDAADD
ncbi:fibronectin type III domain-containing protein [Luteimicrobium sp. NPDC057192]|uniref:fibronectin type III domain-containing protein n=1 Tax=Luteimicrobium sp. NPDC057192 TaxID=3346042 RepID=UPI00363E8F2B